MEFLVMADKPTVGIRTITGQFESVRTNQELLAIAYATLLASDERFPNPKPKNITSQSPQLQEAQS